MPLLHPFDNYCVGEANRAAVNAARAIAEGSGKEVFSLVLLTGPHGAGKTHLLSAIAAEAQKRKPAGVRLMSSTLFVEQFQTLLRKKGAEGLNPLLRGEEQDELFETVDPYRMAELVLQGLSRL